MKTKMKTNHALSGLISGLILLAASTSHAALILSENFNDYFGGNHNAQQLDTGLDVYFGGNIPDFNKSGGGALHAVDLSGSGNFAIMMYADNVMTLASPISANTLGVSYSVAFDAGPAAYSGPDGNRTQANDGLVINILLANNSVLSSFTYQPGAWAGSETLSPTGFLYTGDGSGDVRVSVAALVPGNTDFGGAIDNLTIQSVPEPGTALFGLACVGVAALRRRRRA